MKWAIIILGIVLVFFIAYMVFNYFIIKDVKNPEYTILEKYNNIEVRHYPPLLVAEVTATGTRAAAAKKGFKQLAAFIFGDNENQQKKSEKIQMTAPVLQQPSTKISMTAPVLQSEATNGQWTIKFVMPKTFTMKNLPRPNNTNITIREIPAKKVIAIRFSGTSHQTNLNRHEDELMQYINTHHIHVVGKIEYAFYNPPWTLPMQRRNEILIDIEKKGGKSFPHY